MRGIVRTAGAGALHGGGARTRGAQSTTWTREARRTTICPPPGPQAPMDASTFAAEIETHRRYLMRVAQLQLREREVAEDVVQDTIVAALAGADGFDGR